MTERFDAIIVGSGQAANPLAAALAKAGKKTAVIESKHVGGTCINEGCTPTKTMVASGRVAYLARRGADYGVHTGPISIDLAKVRQRKRGVVESFRSGSEKRLQTTQNIELIYGFADFISPKTLHVDLRAGGSRTLQADWIFLNTGLRAALPTIPGLLDIPFLTNESIMELDAIPEHLLIIGGGYIGLEFGQMFRRFGSQVTIIHHGHQLLDHEDPDVAEEVRKTLTEDGIEVLFEAQTIAADSDNSIRLTIRHAGETRTLAGSHLLVAAGRSPNTSTLNLAATGVEVDSHGYIKINEFLETGVPGIYALGDVKGGPAFTHISYDDYRIIQANLLHGERRSIKDRILPYTVFIDPQLGRIGLTETEARKQGLKIRVAKMPMSYVARAIETDETRGFMKIIVDSDTEEILGAAVLGIEGGEIAAIIQIAMQGKLKYTALRDGIFSHPTLSESLNNVFFNWTDQS